MSPRRSTAWRAFARQVFGYWWSLAFPCLPIRSNAAPRVSPAPRGGRVPARSGFPYPMPVGSRRTLELSHASALGAPPFVPSSLRTPLVDQGAMSQQP
jgi:hypothetical protein